MKKLLSLALTFALVATLILPAGTTALATGSSTTLDVTDTSNLPTGVTYAGNLFTIGTGANNSTISVTGTTTINTIAVSTGVTGLTLLLNGVSITSPSGGKSPIDLQGTASVTIQLADGTANTMDAVNAGIYAGIMVANNSVLTITGSTGVLNASGGSCRSGIGVGTGGTITISGGTVNATGGQQGSGIGGGSGAAGGTITISGGTVNATSNHGGAAIGGGIQGAGGTIAISGGTVNATGNDTGAGIGGGQQGAGGNIAISGSATVIAIGGYSVASAAGGAGIGGGYLDTLSGTITISGTPTIIAASGMAAYTGNKPAIDAKSGSGSIINAQLDKAISLATVSYLRCNGHTLALPACYRSFAFRAAAAADVKAYSDSGCTTFLGSIVTTAANDANIPLTDLSAPTNATAVKLLSATVTVNENGLAWINGTPTINLSTSNSSLTGTVTGTLSSNIYTFSGLDAATTYYVWDTTSNNYTDKSITSASAILNYYTLTLSSAAGTSSPTGGGIYLVGQSVPIEAHLKPGYTWSKWTSSNPTSLPAPSEQSTTITMPAGQVTLTATATATPYDITYTLNGGTAGTPANPTSYTVESPNITLNNPTRADCNFLGWTGSNGTTAQTSVTIPKGSTGNKTYTANWKADAPPKPTSDIVNARTDTSITIYTQAGYEYSVDNGAHWQTSLEHSYTFTGLTANTEYYLICRKAVETTGSQLPEASDPSPALTVKTKYTGSVTAPTLDAVTYDPSQKLSNIALPAGSGWAWSAPATIPTVINTGYGAIYTPTDAATVDYSGVTGYAVDGGGKVTITRVIPLTVNRATPTAADFTFTAPTSLGYDKTAKSATVTAKSGISGMGTVDVKYYDKDNTVVNAPTNAGTYTVKIDIAQGDNYVSATALTDNTWTFTITKAAQASFSIIEPTGVITYGDSITLSAPGGSSGNTVTWAVTSGSSATVDASGKVAITGVGETTITATRTADENYLAAVTDTYTFTPTKRLITVDAPSATSGWTKTYDGKTDFDKSSITLGSIANKLLTDVVNVTVHSATYDAAAIGSGNKTLTITYAIDGAASGFYLAPSNTLITTASITAAAPTISLKDKTVTSTGKMIEIDAAEVKGITSGTAPNGAITYTYYTKDTCMDGDKTTVDKSGAATVGGAPKNAGTYYVTAAIAASGNYTAATSAAATLKVNSPSDGGSSSSTPASADKSSAPVIVDGKTVDMGTSETKDGTTTVKVDQSKMTEQLKSAKDSVVIPVTSKTGTAATELVVQNVEDMAKKGMTLTVQSSGVNYNLPANAVDTGALLKGLGATDSSKVTFTVTMTELSKSSVTIKNGTLMVPPMEFTVTAAYSGKSVAVESFEAYVQRDIELPSGVDPKTITTAVVLETNGTQRHVPTEVYSKGGKWYAKINSMTNSTYALIQSSASFSDSIGKWYDAVVTEMASRKIISGIGENMFAGERAITRAEFSAIIVRALGLPTDSTAAGAFSDVSANQWYYGAVGTAYEYGLVTGKSEGQFDPTGNITRQEAMAMIARAAKLAGYTGKADSISGFSDVDEIGAWASDAVKFNVGSGLIVGSNGQLRPQDEISRAETATVVLRLLRNSALIDVRN